MTTATNRQHTPSPLPRLFASSGPAASPPWTARPTPGSSTPSRRPAPATASSGSTTASSTAPPSTRSWSSGSAPPRSPRCRSAHSSTGGSKLRRYHGDARAARVSDHRSFLDAQVFVAARPTTRRVPLEPLLALQTMVTRRTSGGDVLGAGGALTVRAALQAASLAPAASVSRLGLARSSAGPDGKVAYRKRHEAPSCRVLDPPRFEGRSRRAVQVESCVGNETQHAGLERVRQDLRSEEGESCCDVPRFRSGNGAVEARRSTTDTDGVKRTDATCRHSGTRAGPSVGCPPGRCRTARRAAVVPNPLLGRSDLPNVNLQISGSNCNKLCWGKF